VAERDDDAGLPLVELIGLMVRLALTIEAAALSLSSSKIINGRSKNDGRKLLSSSFALLLEEDPSIWKDPSISRLLSKL